MITLSSLLECPSCGLDVDTAWPVADAESMDEVYEVPDVAVTCPACTHTWEAEYPGWLHTNEA